MQYTPTPEEEERLQAARYRAAMADGPLDPVQWHQWVTSMERSDLVSRQLRHRVVATGLEAGLDGTAIAVATGRSSAWVLLVAREMGLSPRAAQRQQRNRAPEELLAAALADGDLDADAWRAWVNDLPPSVAVSRSMRHRLVATGLRAGLTAQQIGEAVDRTSTWVTTVAREMGLGVREARAEFRPARKADQGRQRLEEAVADGQLSADEWRQWSSGLVDADRAPGKTRDRVIATGILAGITLEEIGSVLGLTRERARQIGKQMGLNASEQAAQRDQAIKAAEQAQRDAVLASSRRCLGHPLQVVADDCQLPLEQVQELIGAREVLHEPVLRSSTMPRVPDEELLQVLRDWAEQTTHHTADDYAQWALERKVPGPQTVRHRWGTWTLGMQAAGLGDKAIASVRDSYDRIPDEELRAAVVEFLTSDHDKYTSKAYGPWARAHGRPSVATLKTHLGTWRDIMEQARAQLRATHPLPSAPQDGTTTRP